MTTSTPPTTAGLLAELRDLPIGGVLSRATRVPIADRADLFAWRKSITPLVSKTAGTFTMQTLQAVDDTVDHAVAAVVITRLS